MHRDGTPDEFDRDREDWEDAQQLAKQALAVDLHAIEARLAQYLDNDDFPSAAFRDCVVLLAYVRTLRAVLQGIAGDERHSCLLCGMLGEHRLGCQAANALGQATDA